jgi:hypothetical protein
MPPSSALQLPDTPLDTAHFYAIVFNKPVFPVRVIVINGAAKKCPAIAKRDGGNGHKDATTDWDQIAQWWGPRGKYRDALIGMPTGLASCILILDIDVKADRSGFDTLADLGKTDLPETPMVHTRSGGLHLWFTYDGKIEIRNSAGIHGLGPGLDIRGEGGWVVLPGANSGYTWDAHWHLDTVTPIPAPAWLGHRSKPQRRYHGDTRRWTPQTILAEACTNIRTAPEGSKHEILNREVYCVATLAAAGALKESEAHHALGIATAALIAHSGCNAEQTWRFFDKAWSDGLAAPRRLRTGKAWR